MGTVVELPLGPPRCPDHPREEPETGFGLAGGGYGVYILCPICCRVLSKYQEHNDLKVTGVSRDGDNNRCLIVSLSAVPSDDDLRSLHEFLRAWRPEIVAGDIPEGKEPR